MPKAIPYTRYVVNTPPNENLPPWIGSHIPLYFNERQKQKAKEAAEKYNSPLIDLFKTKKYKNPKKKKTNHDCQ